MKAIASALVVGAALLSAACGKGRVIFNVDVYSFMQGSGSDTLRYPPLPADTIPPGLPPINVSSDSVKVVLPPGFGSSVVDTVHVLGIVDFDNLRGTGNITVQVFLSADSTTIFSGSPAFSFDGALTPGAVTKDTVDVDLLSTFNDLFTGKEVWLAFRANVANTGADGMKGTIRLRALTLRVVIQDKIL